MTEDLNVKNIILKPRDFYLKKLDNGSEVINLRGATAFDEDFINECKLKGVRLQPIKEDEEEE